MFSRESVGACRKDFGLSIESFMKKDILCIYMRTRLTKWGNSYAIRLPKQLVEELQLEESELSLEKKGDHLTLRKPEKEKQLAVLLKDVKVQEELDWGKARGKEAW
jgi:antitoxin MazE